MNLTPWRNQFIQYGFYVIEQFVLCHGYEKIIQTLNSNFVLLHVRRYAFTLAKKILGRRQRHFPWQVSAPPCASILLLLLLKSSWQQGQETFSPSSSDFLFSSTSHSSRCSISLLLSMYILWQKSHLQLSASLSLVSDSVSNRSSILPMFASSRSSYSAPLASSFTPRASFRTLMEMFFLMRQITKLG